MQTPPYPHWVLRPGVPEEVYTDRQEFLEYFYESALLAITRRSRSAVLLGHRRMGKTEIFKRVVNRLFWEQDHTDPNAAVPVFFTFPDEIVSRADFALKYVENFVRWYAAFRLRDPELLSDKRKPLELIESLMPVPELSRIFKKFALGLLKAIDEGGVNLPEEKALYLPREVSDYDDSTIAVFLDEFQNTHLPEYQFRVVGFMQQAVESLTCPHFVTGSAMSILVQDILGRGALFGRFAHQPIEGLTEYWGAELVLRAARYYHVRVPEVMAPVIAERCGGNPFYINAVIQQAADQRKAIQNEDILNEMLVVDISSGFIWAELHDQVSRWIAKVNESGITKWILYLAALEEEERISLTRIQEELTKQGRQVEMDAIKDVLVKLSRGDLVDYKSFDDWFGKVEDPILEEFLKVWGRTEVEGSKRRTVQDTLRKQYQTLKKRVDDYKGYLAEVFMVQVLWNSQRKTLPGQYFHVQEEIAVPRFTYIDQRSRLGAGTGLELDIFAAAGIDVWIAQSKWWRTPVGRPEVEHLLKQAAIVRQREGEDLRSLRVWLFAANGVSAPAKDLLEQEGVLWSTRADLDALLELNGLRTLPDLDADADEM